MKHIMITGTRQGLSDNQYKQVYNLLLDIYNSYDSFVVLHHGDCIGVDAEVNKMARALGYTTIAHPCDIREKRAFSISDETLEPEKPLVRNRSMVDASTFVIAAPAQDEEVLHSGTWATIRYARKKGKNVRILER